MVGIHGTAQQLPSHLTTLQTDFDLEAPNILRTPNLYYAIMSHKTGYRPNNVVYFSAQNLSGPWSIQDYITP